MKKRAIDLIIRIAEFAVEIIINIKTRINGRNQNDNEGSTEEK